MFNIKELLFGSSKSVFADIAAEEAKKNGWTKEEETEVEEFLNKEAKNLLEDVSNQPSSSEEFKFTDLIEEDDYIWAIEPLDQVKYMASFDKAKRALWELGFETDTDIIVSWRLFQKGRFVYSVMTARSEDPEVDKKAKAICDKHVKPFRFRVLKERENLASIIEKEIV